MNFKVSSTLSVLALRYVALHVGKPVNQMVMVHTQLAEHGLELVVEVLGRSRIARRVLDLDAAGLGKRHPVV
jgi:hypothetical protein